MVDSHERDQEAPANGTLPDRRRPGRVVYHNPHLIALLRRRWQASEELPPSDLDVKSRQSTGHDETDDLAAAQGIVTSVLIGAVLWLAIIAAVLLMLGNLGILL